MLYYFLYPYFGEYPFFHVFKYLTFRSGMAFIFGFLIVFFFMPCTITMMKRWQGKFLRIATQRLGLEHHGVRKQTTPSMGGVLILLSLVVSGMIWADISVGFIGLSLALVVGFGLIGFVDDWMNFRGSGHRGLSPRKRLFMEVLVAIFWSWGILQFLPSSVDTILFFPLFRDLQIDLGWFFIPFSVCVVVGCANGVNLTDGLDGLVTVPAVIVAGSFGFIAYFVGHSVFADYLHVPFIRGVGELSVICGAMIGSCLGFLWYNAPPARIFMGDTGSLPIGALIGGIAVMTKHELTLLVIGGLFVFEALSVMVQMFSFRVFGRRVFQIAPFHHHLEKKGWEESTIVIRLWIITLLLALAGLAMLKLR